MTETAQLPVEVAQPTLEISQKQVEFVPAPLEEVVHQDIVLLEQTPRDAIVPIESTLEKYALAMRLTPEQDYSIEDDTPTGNTPPVTETVPPTLNFQEAPPPTPAPEAEPPFDPVATTEKFNDIIKLTGESPTYAYDRLVYTSPEKAQKMADAGNKDAAEALARRDELAKNPSASTALENVPSEQKNAIEKTTPAEIAQMQPAEMIRYGSTIAEALANEIDNPPTVETPVTKQEKKDYLLALLAIMVYLGMAVSKVEPRNMEGVAQTLAAQIDRAKKENQKRKKKKDEAAKPAETLKEPLATDPATPFTPELQARAIALLPDFQMSGAGLPSSGETFSSPAPTEVPVAIPA